MAAGRRLSEQMKDILLWLAKKEGRLERAPDWSTQMKKLDEMIEARGIENLLNALAPAGSVIGAMRNVDHILVEAKRLGYVNPLLPTSDKFGETTVQALAADLRHIDPSVFISGVKQEPKVRSGVKWSPKAYLGRTPTKSESASLSRTLDRLERLELIKGTGNRGKRKKTTHLKLTTEGIMVVNELLPVNNSN